jgi:hypothetical protein
MDGRHLADSRNELLEALDESDTPNDEHGLRSLRALSEAFTELEARVEELETPPN